MPEFIIKKHKPKKCQIRKIIFQVLTIMCRRIKKTQKNLMHPFRSTHFEWCGVEAWFLSTYTR